MPIIQRPDLVAKVRKALELSGPDAIATVSPELVPVVVVETLESAEGDPYKYCIGTASQSGVAGQYGQIIVFNPAGSGVELIVDRMAVTAGGSEFFEIRVHSATLANPATSANRNRGRSGEPAGLVRRTTAAVPVGAAIGNFRSTNGDLKIIDLDYQCAENIGVGITNTTVNLLLQVIFWWREIPT